MRFRFCNVTRPRIRALRRARDPDCALFILVYCFHLSAARRFLRGGVIYHFWSAVKTVDRVNVADECIGIISRGIRGKRRYVLPRLLINNPYFIRLPLLARYLSHHTFVFSFFYTSLTPSTPPCFSA